MMTPLLPEYNLTRLDTIHHCSAETLLNALPDASVDAVITDPPYGFDKTKTEWDSKGLPFDVGRFIGECMRVIKKRGALCMFATPPFSAYALMAGRDYYRDTWYAKKSNGSNFGTAKYQPLRVIEEVLIFSRSVASPNQFTKADSLMRYYPQMRPRVTPYRREVKAHHKRVTNPSLASHVQNSRPISTDWRYESYPINLIDMSAGKRGLHPTQKPVHTLEYLIETYTQCGDLIVDPFAGSGTTAVAAQQLGRHFIGCDISAEYVEVSRQRLTIPFMRPLFTPPLQDTAL